MKRWSAAALVCLLLGLHSLAWAQLPIRTYLLQSGAAANGNGLVAHAAGFSVAGVQVALPTGATPSFTINFESSINDVHYTATLCQPIGGTTLATTTTAIGQWRCNIAGSVWFRSRLSGYSGPGSVTVLGTLIGGDAAIGLAENSPLGSQSVNQSGSWTVQASHQGGQWNIDKVSHLTAAMAHVIGTVTIEGRGTAGSAAGGVVTVQGVASGTVVPVSLSSTSVNQSGSWTVQAAHQGGQWNVAHVTSATHVVGVVSHPYYEQSDTFTVNGAQAGTTVATTSGPVKSYAIQVSVTGGPPQQWYVHLEASLDGSAFTKVIAHEQSTVAGTTIFSGATFYPARFFRANVTGLTVNGGTLTARVLGMN